MEYRSPVCRARICRKSPLIFQHPSFILARRNNRHHFRVSSRMMPMPPGYTKVFGFAPTWCTTNALQKAARRFFATFKEGRRFCAFFLGIRDIGMMAGSARPLQINQKRHFGGEFRLGRHPALRVEGELVGDVRHLQSKRWSASFRDEHKIPKIS